LPNQAQQDQAFNPGGFRLEDGELVILASRRTSWLATFFQIVSLGLYIPWWNAAWFSVTERRLLAKQGIFNKTEVALPLHFVQDASVERSWLGVGRVDVSTAGGSDGSVVLEPLTAADARLFADTILGQAKLVGRGSSHASATTANPVDALHASLTRLGELRDNGILTEDEFAAQKAKILASDL
jgi:uncharacterized membrane protein YdbT with pleckstrin-like domain